MVRQLYKSDNAKTPKSRFLFSLNSRSSPPIRTRADPVIARLYQHLSPQIRGPVYLSPPTTRGEFPSIDDASAELPANLRITFFLQHIANDVVSGDGVGDDFEPWVGWKAHSSVATDELWGGGYIHGIAPLPGESWPIPNGIVIYDALVADGCGNTPVCPIEFESKIEELHPEGVVDVGEFIAVDDMTLQPNGYWTFSYTIRATSDDGVSDFKLAGVVAVVCSNKEDTRVGLERFRVGLKRAIMAFVSQ